MLDYAAAMPDNKSDFDILAKRYLDLWQDQVNVLAADPAMAEAVAKGISALSGGIASMMGGSGMQQPGGMNVPAASGAEAPSTPSSGAGIDVAGLVGRIAELESRVAELEKLAGQGRAGRRTAGSGKGGRALKPRG